MRPCGTADTHYSQTIAIFRTRFQWIMLALFIVAFFTLVPLFANRALLDVIIIILVTIIAVQGLNILVGYTGQISLGQAALMAVGAYTSAILTTSLGWSFWLALPCSAFMAGIVGLIFGLPSIRLRGFYLALSTLAAQFIIIWIIVHLNMLTGGVEGMKAAAPTIGSIVIDSEVGFFFLIGGFTAAIIYFTKNLVRSRYGRAFVAIRDNDLAASVMGINVFRYKLLAFFISAVYAGIAGSLWAHYVGYITPDQFSLVNSLWYLGMLVIGGMGTVMGPIFGIVFLKAFEQIIILSTPYLGQLLPFLKDQATAALTRIIFGLIIVLFLVFEPRGLAHRWEIAKATIRRWPFPY